MPSAWWYPPIFPRLAWRGLCGIPLYLGRFGILRHRHAALALDRPQPQRAVAAGAREHDADRSLVLIVSQRFKEKSMGRRWPRGAAGSNTLERAVVGLAWADIRRRKGKVPEFGSAVPAAGS